MKIKELPNDLKEKLNKFEIKPYPNIQEYQLNDIRFIIVGDNPGEVEVKESKYFVGPSGKILRNRFLEEFKLVDDFDKSCIVFNKTVIHTKQTQELRVVKQKIGIDLFNEILYFCAKEVAEIANKKNLPVLIFGKNRVLKQFKEKLHELLNENIRVLEFNHPASRHHFYNAKNNELFNSLKN